MQPIYSHYIALHIHADPACGRTLLCVAHLDTYQLPPTYPTSPSPPVVQAHPEAYLSLGLLLSPPGGPTVASLRGTSPTAAATYPSPICAALVVALQRVYEALLPGLEMLLAKASRRGNGASLGTDNKTGTNTTIGTGTHGGQTGGWGAALAAAKLQALACFRALLFASTPATPITASSHSAPVTWTTLLQELLTSPGAAATDDRHAGAFLRDALTLFGPALRAVLVADGEGAGADGGYVYEAILASGEGATLLPDRLRVPSTGRAGGSSSSSSSNSISSAPVAGAGAGIGKAFDPFDPAGAPEPSCSHP